MKDAQFFPGFFQFCLHPVQFALMVTVFGHNLLNAVIAIKAS